MFDSERTCEDVHGCAWLIDPHQDYAHVCARDICVGAEARAARDSAPLRNVCGLPAFGGAERCSYYEDPDTGAECCRHRYTLLRHGCGTGPSAPTGPASAIPWSPADGGDADAGAPVESVVSDPAPPLSR